jgi:hypothetical protein
MEQEGDKMIHIGIDPGLKGAVAVVQGSKILHLFDMPLIEITTGQRPKFGARKVIDVGTLHTLFLDIKTEFPCLAMIEKLSILPHDGNKSNETAGQNYGMLLSVFELLQISYQEVSAVTWQSQFNYADRKAGSDKSQNVRIAIDLFPECKTLFLGPRGGLKDGRADALLIAAYSQIKCPKI